MPQERTVSRPIVSGAKRLQAVKRREGRVVGRVSPLRQRQVRLALQDQHHHPRQQGSARHAHCGDAPRPLHTGEANGDAVPSHQENSACTPPSLEHRMLDAEAQDTLAQNERSKRLR